MHRLTKIFSIKVSISLFGVFCLAVGYAFSSSARADAPGVYPDRIVFGQTAVLTGPEGGRGESLRRGILAAFGEVNRQGGIQGRRLVLLSKDDRYSPRKAVANVRPWFESEQIFALIGCTGTGVSKFVIPVALDSGIPYIGALTGAAFLRDRTSFPNVVNLRVSYLQESEAWIQYLESIGKKRIAVFFQDDAFGRSGAQAVRDALSKRGMLIVARGSYARSLTAVASAVFDIRKAAPDAVVLIGTNRPIASFIRQMRSLGVDPLFVSVSVVGNKALKEDLGNSAEGVIISQPLPSPWEKDPIPFVQEFLQAIDSVTTDEAHDVELIEEFEYWIHEPNRELSYINYLTLEGYAIGRLVIEALERIEGELTPAALLSAIFESGPFDLGGLKLEFKPDSNQGLHDVYMTMLHNEEKSEFITKLRIEEIL